MSLEAWGWNEEWARRYSKLNLGAAEPARVVGQHRDRWSVQTLSGPASARLTPGARPDLYPAVGDWVAVQPGPTAADPLSVLAVLPRRSAFSRGAAGTGAVEQVLAANVDTVWVVHGLDVPPNPRRLERYLAVAWESGALPAVVLTKSDLAADLAAAVAEVERIALGVPVLVVSAEQTEGVQELRASLTAGCTVALLGPSGAGKSTLVNRLSGRSVAASGPVRAGDRKGRHTTTHRELFRIPGGALLLDTPGLRELRVWELGEGLDQAFPDIEQLARSCRFRDCRHETEPGCAVLEALSAGRLEASRLASFRKLQAEAAFAARRTDHQAQAAAVAKHKSALRTLKYHQKYSNRK